MKYNNIYFKEVKEPTRGKIESKSRVSPFPVLVWSKIPTNTYDILKYWPHWIPLNECAQTDLACTSADGAEY